MPLHLVNHSMRPIVIDNQTPPGRVPAHARLPSTAPVPAPGDDAGVRRGPTLVALGPERGGNLKSSSDRTFGRGALCA